MSARAEARKAELWLEDIASQPSWPLRRVLVWIGWLDYDLMSTWLRGGDGPCWLPSEFTEWQLCKTVDEAAKTDPAATDSQPLLALEVKLAAGSVKALGTRITRPAWQAYSGRVPDAYIPADAWRSNKLSDWYRTGLGGMESDPSVESPYLIPSDWKWRPHEVPDPYWSAVCIERKSLLEQFPPRYLDPHTATPRGDAKRDLIARCRAHYDDHDGPVPVGAKWRTEMQERYALGERATRGIWREVAVQYPDLSERKGKPKGPRRTVYAPG